MQRWEPYSGHGDKSTNMKLRWKCCLRCHEEHRWLWTAWLHYWLLKL